MLQTIQQLLQLAQKNNLPILDAELIIAHVLKKPREFVLAHPEQNTTYTQQNTINKLIKKRVQGIPLAYLTGHKEFYGLDFIVNKYTLIPRPDTELMVSLVLDEIERLKDSKIIMIDVGTGTGCIPISIIQSLNHSIFKSFAIDISKPALSVARRNAKLHNVKIKFLHGDLLSPILNSSFINHYSSIIITANLPYLTPQQFKSESSIQHEPKSALVAGKNGHELYEKLFKQIRQLLPACAGRLTPYSLLLFIEIDPRQTKTIKQLIKKYLPQAKTTIHKDLAGLDRIVEMKF